MRTKVEKDGADLIALLNPEPERYVVREEFDFNLLKQLVRKHDLHFFRKRRKSSKYNKCLRKA